jgi:hemerythrin
MEWNDSLNTGIELLDRQHRSLLDCVNEFKRSGARGGVLKSAMAMDALRTYVTVHFATEEDLMRQCGYPELAAHIAEHRAFVSRLDALMQENVRRDNTAELTRFFEHWLENHLCHSDKKYMPYLAALKRQDGTD